MPVTEEQIALLKKQQALVEQLKTVLATQQRTLASLGAQDNDYETAETKHFEGCDSDNEGEINRLVADAGKAEAEKSAAKEVDAEAGDAERGFMAVKPWLGNMKEPSGWDRAASAQRDAAPNVTLEIDHVIGYRARGSRSNIAYIDATTVVYPVAALGVVHDISTNKQKFFKSHTDDVLCLDYNPTKRLVATGQQGKRPSIFVWSVDDPSQPVAEFSGHSRAVVAVAISPDGSKVASVGLDDDHTILVHDIATKSLIASTKGDSARILGVYWNLTAAANSTTEFLTVGVKHIAFWTLAGAGLTARKGLLGRLGEQQSFLDAAFTPDYTVIGCESGDLYLFDGNKLKSKVPAHNGAVFSVCTDPATNFIVTGGRDGFLNCWERQSLKNTATIDLNPVDPCNGLNSVKALKVLPNGGEPKILIGTISNAIYDMPVKHGVSGLKRVVTSHYGDLSRSDSYGELWGLATHPTQPNIIATTAEDSTVRLWDLTKKKQIAYASYGAGRCVAFSPSGNFLALGFVNGTLAVLNASDLSEVCKFKRHSKPILCVSFSPDGLSLATGCADGVIDLYSVTRDDVSFRAKLTGATSNVLHLDFSADSNWLQACSQAYELLFFNVVTAKFHPKAEELKDVNWATFTSILGWNVQGIWEREMDGSDINQVNISRAKDLIVTSDDSRLIRVLNYPCVGSGLDSRGSLGVRPASVAGRGHSEHVTHASFTSDDKFIVSTGGADCAIMIWKLKRN